MNYRITTVAKDALVEMATHYHQEPDVRRPNLDHSVNYIRPPRYKDTMTKLTMQPFLRALSTCQFTDTRDPDIIALDLPRAQHNLPPLWYQYLGPANRDPRPELRRWQWGIVIPPATQTAFLAIATHYNIHPLPPSKRTPSQREYVQAVLEAIGQGSLTPTNLPIAYHKTPRRYKSHLTSLSVMPPLPEMF
jgi:hypothetical protein